MQDKITLKNGIRIIFDPIPFVRSASFGIWIEAGSVMENNKIKGISHFIEHMVFKGTKNRNAMELASDFDLIGGQANAFTSKEMTCFYVKTLDTHVLKGFELLLDMLQNSTYEPKSIKTEKNVVIEEIAMSEDSPEDLVVERLCDKVWEGHPLASRILGSKKTVSSFNPEMILEYVNKYYCPKNIVISISGNFNKDEIISFINEKFGDSSADFCQNPSSLATYKKSITVFEKDIEQNHLCLGFSSYINAEDDKYYSLSVLNTIFGGGMSSRLFQKIREKSGLAYSIYSFPIRHKDAGLFCIYAGLNANAEEKAIKLINKEITEILKHGVSSDELIRAREQLKASVIMGLESTSSRMSHMGRNETLHNNIKSLNDIIAKIDGVTNENIIETAKDIFKLDEASISVVGKTKKEEFYKNFI